MSLLWYCWLRRFILSRTGESTKMAGERRSLLARITSRRAATQKGGQPKASGRQPKINKLITLRNFGANRNGGARGHIHLHSCLRWMMESCSVGWGSQ